MKKKTRITIAVALVAVLGVLAYALTRPDEGPVYEGKTVSYWLKQTRWTSPHQPKFDSNAVPYLVRALEAKDGPVKQFYIQQWTHLPQWVRNILPTPVPQNSIRMSAFSALYSLGPEAKSAVPALIRLTNESSDYAYISIHCLARIDKYNGEVQHTLIEASKSTNILINTAAREVTQGGFRPPPRLVDVMNHD